MQQTQKTAANPTGFSATEPAVQIRAGKVSVQSYQQDPHILFYQDKTRY
jgi:hypothetical protein